MLIIHGTEDPVVSYAHALKLHATIHGSRLVTLPGTGHELHRSDWPAILQAIEEHTNGEAPATADLNASVEQQENMPLMEPPRRATRNGS